MRCRTTLVLGLVLAFAFADRAPGADAALRWAPVEAGLRWVYAVEREKVRALNGTSGERERFTGELEKVIVRPLSRFGIGAFEMRETFTGLIAGESGKHRESKRSVVRPREAGYSVIAEEINDAFIGDRGLARFQPPLRFLPPDPETNGEWDVGTARFNDLVAEIRGEVLGYQDLETPAGRFKRCLKVRYTATVSGEISVFGLPLPLETGTNTSITWYARDVGRVMSEEETHAVVRLASGGELELRQTLRYALKSSTRLDPAPQPGAKTSLPAASQN